MPNLLTASILSVAGDRKLSLPGLLAAMARGEVSGFPALRPHQRAAWHMFLVQLAVLALDAGERDDLPRDEEAWAAALRGLTPEWPDDEPWRLVVEDSAAPAFLQPPAHVGWEINKKKPWTTTEGGLEYEIEKVAPTPDALDMLITSRNHDLKGQVARDAAPEDWVFALVSLQTMEGYGGAGNQGIARMNGGSSSRPLLGLAPAAGRDVWPDPAQWWARDVRHLMKVRAAGQSPGPGTAGGSALLWCLGWPEGRQCDPEALDPLFLEVCRRVRLVHREGGYAALRANSKATRTDAKALNGILGDPWAPVHIADNASLTLNRGSFTYRRLVDLLFSGDWKVPSLAKPDPEEAGEFVIVAEALSRGNSKTDGLKSRIVPVPRAVRPLLFSKTAGDLAHAQMEEIAAHDRALRDGLALMAAGGVYENLDRDHYSHAAAARAAFDRQADAMFFRSLWTRLAAAQAGDHDAGDSAMWAFRDDLRAAATEEFEWALPGIPCSAIFRPRAEVRARRAFRGRLGRERMLKRREAEDDAA